jgi:phosphoesterase RecJ-like protein
MEEHFQTYQKIKEQIDRAKTILVIAHQNPDGDAIGSLLAICHYLKKQNKECVAFCLNPIPDHFFFLPEAESITSNKSVCTQKEFDLIIVLDSGDLDYAGMTECFRHLKGLPVVINIDHHFTNKCYGHINLVDSTASSTSEIIFHFFDYFRFQINKELATCLLTGILTDTGSFSNLGTTPSSLAVASKLLAYGARVRDITENLVRNKSLNQLKLWGRALSRVKRDEKTGIVSTIITKNDTDELNLGENGIEGIANFLNNLDHAKAIIVLREQNDNTIKASLRTNDPQVDVSELARQFGGGGHKKAAGFSVKGKIVETGDGWKIV